jgi:carotenoid cleavage dioxygenase-like enzyme
MTFSFEIIYNTKKYLNFSTIENFKFKYFNIDQNGEMIKTKVVDLHNFQNYIMDSFFIWNHFCCLKI